jgi:hypothetical protein
LRVGGLIPAGAAAFLLEAFLTAIVSYSLAFSRKEKLLPSQGE